MSFVNDFGKILTATFDICDARRVVACGRPGRRPCSAFTLTNPKVKGNI